MGVELETIIPLTMGKLKFGVGATEELGYELKSLGARNVLLVTDKGLWEHGLVDKVKGIIEGEKIALRIFDAVHCEPTDRSMRQAIEMAGDFGFDAVVALGGGSTMDTAKAVNLYRTHPADLLEYVNAPIGRGKPVPGPLKPLIALPTTSGSGSETTPVIVMDFLDLHLKTGISHQHIRPTVALVDPLNSLSAPAAVTANTGLDVLTHAAESFTIKAYNMRPRTKDPAARPPYVGANPISDLWSEKAIEWVGKYLRRAFYNGADVEAKSHMAMAATFAGIGFGNAGVHIPHALGYPIAGMVKGWVPPGYPSGEPMVPHGLSVALTAAAIPLHGPHRSRAARPHRRPARGEHGGTVGDGGGPQAPGRVRRADAGHRRAERPFRDRIHGGRHPRPGGGRLEAAAAAGGQPAAGDESRPGPHRRAVHEALVGSHPRKGDPLMKAPVRNCKLFVGGKWVSEKESMPVIDKFTGETFASVPVASRETVGPRHPRGPRGVPGLVAHAGPQAVQDPVERLPAPRGAPGGGRHDHLPGGGEGVEILGG